MDRYEIVRRVTSKGAFGEIFVVKHRHEGLGSNQYVLKRARLTKMSEAERARLAAEVHIHHQLQRGLPEQHGNIVSFKESFADRGVFGCILLEYCTGGDLASKMNTFRNKGRMLEEAQALEWFGQINSAVEYVHSQRILHRDIKMQNVFLTADGVCKLGDFGLAIALPEGCDTVTETLGTITAMAPELFDRKPGGFPADVWALGTLLYELCAQTNICQVPCDSYGLIVNRYRTNLRKPIRPLNTAHYSESCQRLVDNLLQIDQRKRPSCQKITEYLTDIEGLVPSIEKHIEKKQVKSKISSAWKGSQQSVQEKKEKVRPKAPRQPLSGRRAAAVVPAPDTTAKRVAVVPKSSNETTRRAAGAKGGLSTVGERARLRIEEIKLKAKQSATTSAGQQQLRTELENQLQDAQIAESLRSDHTGGQQPSELGSFVATEPSHCTVDKTVAPVSISQSEPSIRTSADNISAVDESAPAGSVIHGRRAANPEVRMSDEEKIELDGSCSGESSLSHKKLGDRQVRAASAGPTSPSQLAKAKRQGHRNLEQQQNATAAKVEPRSGRSRRPVSARVSVASNTDGSSPGKIVSRGKRPSSRNGLATSPLPQRSERSRITSSVAPLRPHLVSKPKVGERVDIWFASSGDWCEGFVSSVASASFHAELAGIGQMGPFHCQRDRFQLWRPKKLHPALPLSRSNSSEVVGPLLPTTSVMAG